jgi:hypothetical protein
MTESTSTELSVQGESLQRLYSQYTQGRFLVNRRYQRKTSTRADATNTRTKVKIKVNSEGHGMLVGAR